MTAEPEPVERAWTYSGRRLGSNNRLYHAWRDHEGEERFYSKLTATVICGTYTVFDRGGGTVSPPAGWTGVLAVELVGHREAWVLADKAAYTEHQRIKLAAKLKREQSFDGMTLAEVRTAIDRAGPQRYAVIAHVLRVIGA